MDALGELLSVVCCVNWNFSMKMYERLEISGILHLIIPWTITGTKSTYNLCELIPLPQPVNVASFLESGTCVRRFVLFCQFNDKTGQATIRMNRRAVLKR